MTRYHDEEWGVPTHDDRELFELLVLEGAQAGLSWRTVLLRREGYRKVFADFDPTAVAEMGPEAQAELLTDPGIIRNRAKVASAVGNARAFLAVQAELGSFDAYLWGWVDRRAVINTWSKSSEVPVSTDLAGSLSTDLRRRGFCFVGPTICYAYLQATGVVMDHLTGCFRHAELACC